MSADEAYRRLQDGTRLYGRSKGLTLIGQGIAFTLGVIPLLYILRRTEAASPVVAAGLYAAGAAFFLFAVWVGLRWVPGLVDRAYYLRVADVRASEPTTPGWGRFLAPLSLLAPICAAGMGLCDAWQAVVVALVAFGLYMYLAGRFVIREPGTEIIGAVTILLGGLAAALPDLGPARAAGSGPAWLKDVLAAQTAALAIVAWLGAAWIGSGIILHIYNRLLLAGLVRGASRETLDEGGSPHGD